MKLGEALKRIYLLQPSSFGKEDMIAWLQQLDLEIYNGVILTHEGWEQVERPEYDPGTPDSTELLVAAPYDAIYEHWLQSRIDYALGETARYNNSNAAFEADRLEYRAWYNRTHMPLTVRGRYW